MEANHAESTIDTTGLTVGVVVGVPAAVGVAALMATARSFFGTTNAALVLMIVVVAVAALGGRVAGIVTALAAVVSFDFFHTKPYLSLAIDSRDDIETTVLLLDRRGCSSARSPRRAARRAAARDRPRTTSGASTAWPRRRPRAPMRPMSIAVAQDELRELLTLRECRFEALPRRRTRSCRASGATARSKAATDDALRP